MQSKIFLTIFSLILFPIFLVAQCWKQVDVNLSTSFAIKADSTLWAWGSNSWGQYGNPALFESNLPVQVSYEHDWVYVCAGSRNAAAIKNDGTLWTCGLNSEGQLGNDTLNYSSPIFKKLEGNLNWKIVSVGSDHMAAITSNGSLWTWGSNNNGQLGDGTNTRKRFPVQVGTDTNWKNIFCSDEFTIGIKTDGTIWAFGSNSFGQLGTGTTTNYNIPFQIGTDSDWNQINIGEYSCFAIKSNGSLWAWGGNSKGQLGDGTTINKNTPIQIGIATDWAHISSADQHSMGIKIDGKLWGWGSNDYGQLGNTSFFLEYSPKLVDDTKTWSQIAGGNESSIVLNTDGDLYSAGWNFKGQLGLGNFGNTDQFVKIDCPITSSTINSFTTYLIQLSPNPAQQYLNLLIENMDLTDVIYEIRNMLGELIVSEQVLNHNQTINISQYSNGVYVLNIKNKHGQLSKKFIKI